MKKTIQAAPRRAGICLTRLATRRRRSRPPRRRPADVPTIDWRKIAAFGTTTGWTSWASVATAAEAATTEASVIGKNSVAGCSTSAN